MGLVGFAFAQRPIKNRRMKEVEKGGKDSFLGRRDGFEVRNRFFQGCTMHSVFFYRCAHAFRMRGGFSFFFFSFLREERHE